MSRFRGPDLPQRQPNRVPLRPRSISESNILRRQAAAAVTGLAKPVDRRASRAPSHEIRKNNVADLEAKLVKAQDELMQLRDQLILSEAAKIIADRAREAAKKQLVEQENLVASQECEEGEVIQDEAAKKQLVEQENLVASQQCEEGEVIQDEAAKDDSGISSNTTDALDVVSNEAAELKASLLEKEKELSILREERTVFEAKAEAETARATAAAREKEDELMARLRSVEEELKLSKKKELLLAEQLKLVEEAKTDVEAEMRRLNVQMEQWRKAAEAGAEALAPGGFRQDEWGPALMVGDGAAEEQRRKAAGVRVFGELWKKKGHHHK